MRILAIETSCDDTCCAILEIKNKKIKILSDVVSSQVKIHRQYGGVYPFLAKREHIKNLPFVFKKSMKKAGNPALDLIVATNGPGLEPCLWTGINFAKELSEKLKLPIVPVNHIEAHLLINFIDKKLKADFLPAVCLVVSGGHTQLILLKGIGQYKILGETRDDAAGECFDKVARILGLGYPGGPAIAAKAAKLQTKNYKLKTKLPRPMMNQKNYDFSFSGLKTAVLYKVKSEKRKMKNREYVEIMCRETQQAIIDVLLHKALRAAKEYQVKSIILGGGVAANNELRKQFKTQSSKLKVNLLVPPKNYCTDNAVMVALAAYYCRLKNKKEIREISADANLKL